MRTKLPKKWFVECNELNREVLNGWRLQKATSYLKTADFQPGDFLLSKHLEDGSYYYNSNIRKAYDYSSYVELTFEEFKTLVLNKYAEPQYEIY